MGPVPDELVRPLAVIDNLFQKQLLESTVDKLGEWGEVAHFIKELGLHDEDRFAAIPCINEIDAVETVQPFSLVRYRGIVQDVFDPEIFAQFFEEHASTESEGIRYVTSKYRDCIEPSPGHYLKDPGPSAFGQRGVFYCVPLPGETQWAKEATAKRSAVAGGFTCVATANGQSTTQASSMVCKRRREDDDDVMGEPDDESSMTVRKGHRATVESTSAVHSQQPPPGSLICQEFGVNFPLSHEECPGRGASTPCILKLYDAVFESLRVCDIFEAVGILCIDPELASIPACARSFGEDARHPSTALVPRVHAICVRHLPFYHPMLPYSSAWLTEARLAEQCQHLRAHEALEATRAVAIQQLEGSVYGDRLVAEYLLMLLVSRGFRKLGEMTLGCWSLNLAGFPDAACNDFVALIAEFKPRTVCLELTRDSLNTKRWCPKKDFDANRLVAAQLQLAPGTLLVLDETKMEAGGLSAEGTKALASLEELVCHQKLSCDFMSYDVPIPLEVSTVVMSSRKSLVSSLLVPVNVTNSSPPSRPSQEALDAVRLFIELIARNKTDLKMSESVTRQVSDDFVTARTKYNVKQELCHTWMNLARAFCFSHGEDEVSLERWHTVFQMESERLRRSVLGNF